MTKYQQEFFDYLQTLEKGNPKHVSIALDYFYKHWKKYEKDGVKDSLRTAMESTIAFVGLPITVHLN